MAYNLHFGGGEKRLAFLTTMSITASFPALSERRPEPPPLPSDPARPAGRCVVVSDRLPIVLAREGGQGWRVSQTGGSLLSALKPVLNERRGVWIGWPGVTQEEAPELRKVLAGAIQEGFSLRPVAGSFLASALTERPATAIRNT